MTGDVLLTVEALTVKRGSQTTLDDISFDLKRGEILGVVGANGAGKSTLLKVLSGELAPKDGTITFAGENFTAANMAEARAIGVGYIPQRISVDEDQTVYDAMFRTSYWSKLTDDEKRSEANTLLKDYGISIAADERMGDLVQAERTVVEILRLANEETALLLLDEVSSTFNDHEISLFHELVLRLVKQGRAVVHVSHRLDELQSLSNRIAVINKGKLRSILIPRDTDRDKLVMEIFDKETEPAIRSRRNIFGPQVLRFDGVALEGKVEPVSFALRSGEVLGITGLRRSGVETLADLIGGMVPATAGSISLNGETKVFDNPEEALRSGIVMLSEADGQVEISDDYNLMSEYSDIDEESGSQSFAEQVASLRKLISILTELGISTPSIHRNVDELSGGDQQKLRVAKTLRDGAHVFVLNQPTRGVDELSRQKVYQLIDEVTKKGSAVALLSSDLSELLAQSDKVAIMRHGELVGIFNTDGLTEDMVMMVALGYKLFTTNNE